MKIDQGLQSEIRISYDLTLCQFAQGLLSDVAAASVGRGSHILVVFAGDWTFPNQGVGFPQTLFALDEFLFNFCRISHVFQDVDVSTHLPRLA